MVKLKGPGLAYHAAGGLGETLIFAESKGRAYAKRWHKPKNPKTPLQTGMRAILEFLSNQWRNLTSNDQATWETLATAANHSPFNAFQRFNLDRWRTGLAPSQIPTTDTAGSYGSVSVPTPTPVSRGIQFDAVVTTPAQRWAILLYHVAAPADPKHWGKFIHAMPTRSAGNITWTWRPIPPGTYYITVGASKIHGELWSGQFDISATVL